MYAFFFLFVILSYSSSIVEKNKIEQIWCIKSSTWFFTKQITDDVWGTFKTVVYFMVIRKYIHRGPFIVSPKATHMKHSETLFRHSKIPHVLSRLFQTIGGFPRRSLHTINYCEASIYHQSERNKQQNRSMMIFKLLL